MLPRLSKRETTAARSIQRAPIASTSSLCMIERAPAILPARAQRASSGMRGSELRDTCSHEHHPAGVISAIVLRHVTPNSLDELFAVTISSVANTGFGDR